MAGKLGDSTRTALEPRTGSAGRAQGCGMPPRVVRWCTEVAEPLRASLNRSVAGAHGALVPLCVYVSKRGDRVGFSKFCWYIILNNQGGLGRKFKLL